MIEGRATARYVRTSAQKAKLVVDLIRGKDVDKALATLRFARKSVAKDVEKVLRSAIANAQQKQGGGDDVERLYVRECHADQGPSLKRIRAAPMGRAFRILKRTAHLTVIVEERLQQGQGASRTRRRRRGPEGAGPRGAGGGSKRRTAALSAPDAALETDAAPEPARPDEPEPRVENESTDTPEPEQKPDPDEPPAAPSPGGILGIR